MVTCSEITFKKYILKYIFMKKRALSGKLLGFILLILIGVFFILNFMGVFSMNNLAIVVKDSEPIRKPFALLFMGVLLLAFIVICLIHKRHQKR